MRPFLIKLIRFVLPILLGLYLLGLAVEYKLYRNTHDAFYMRQADWHLHHRKNIKALFIGNSRTSTQVNLPALVDSFKVPMYCLGQDARRLDILWVKFKKYLERNPAPKVLVLQIDVSSTLNEGMNMSTFFGKERYLTYLFGDQLGINYLFKEEEGFFWYETVIPLIRFIPYPDFFTMYWRKRVSDPYAPPANYGVFLNPYKPENKLKPLNEESIVKGEFNIYNTSAILLNHIDSFAQFCQREQIKLVGVFPPQSYISYKKSKSDSMALYIADYAKKKGIIYRDFNDPCYQHDSLFYNHIHVNERGARIYTNHLHAFLDSIGFRAWIR
jgi:hypothetical protein